MHRRNGAWRCGLVWLAGVIFSSAQTAAQCPAAGNCFQPHDSPGCNVGAVPHTRGTMPELVQCALIHEHFEAIHPFLDGNGRVGRLLITLFLIERGRPSKPLRYLSSYIEQHKPTYYGLLQRIRTHGDWAGWLRFFLRAVRDTARSAVAQSEGILALRTALRDRLGRNHKALALLDALFVNPYTTVARAGAHLGVTAPTARKTIGAMEKIGMLEEVTGRERGRVWGRQADLAGDRGPGPDPGGGRQWRVGPAPRAGRPRHAARRGRRRSGHGTQQSVDHAIWSIRDIMRRGNVASALQYVPELTWILFVRILRTARPTSIRARRAS